MRDVADDPKYKFSDNYVERRGKYYLRDLDFTGSYSVGLDYPIKLNSGKEIYAGGKFGKPNTWRWSKDKFEWGIKNDFIVIDEKKEKIYIKQYQFVDNEDKLRERKIPYRAMIQSLNSEGAKENANLFASKTFDFPKPEALIKRIIEIATTENDIVLDFFAGSGTTLAVAHKMNRRYIGIEQMDYIRSITLERLKKVIDGEQGGVSKAVDWHGGGSVVYAELMPLNAVFKDKIANAQNMDELKQIAKEITQKAFLEYSVDREKLNDMDGLSLNEAKEALKLALDSNMDYVLYGDIDDKTYEIDDETKAFNKEFYGE